MVIIYIASLIAIEIGWIFSILTPDIFANVLIPYISISYYVLIIGFGLIGITFALFFHNFRIYGGRLFTFNMRWILILSLLIVTFSAIFANNTKVSSAESYPFLATISIMLRLITYVGILFLGLAFYHLMSRTFIIEGFERRFKLFDQRLLIMGFLIGIIGIIIQAIYLILKALILYEIISLELPYYRVLEIDSYFYTIHLIDAMASISFILMMIYLLSIFLAIMNFVPKELLSIPLGKIIRMDLKSLFTFAWIMILIFCIIRAVTEMLVGEPRWVWHWGEGLRREPFLPIAYEMHWFLWFCSRLFIYFGFILICVVFNQFLRIWMTNPQFIARKST